MEDDRDSYSAEASSELARYVQKYRVELTEKARQQETHPLATKKRQDGTLPQDSNSEDKVFSRRTVISFFAGFLGGTLANVTAAVPGAELVEQYNYAFKTNISDQDGLLETIKRE